MSGKSEPNVLLFLYICISCSSLQPITRYLGALACSMCNPSLNYPRSLFRHHLLSYKSHGKHAYSWTKSRIFNCERHRHVPCNGELAFLHTTAAESGFPPVTPRSLPNCPKRPRQKYHSSPPLVRSLTHVYSLDLLKICAA